MRKTLLLIALGLFTLPILAQKPTLKFNEKGKFKIVQFTDVHYKKGNPNSDVSVELIKEVLDAEKPDLAIFTGDIVWAKPAQGALDDVFTPVVERKIPFAYVFGNHDDEFDWSRKKIMDYVTQMPYCLAQHGDKSLHGVGNYILEVKSHVNADSVANIFYCLDSGGYGKIKGIGHYDWFHLNQINWFSEQSAAYTASNKGVPFPALAFFHIALPEYEIMATMKDANLIGTRKERECNGYLNTGMFAAMRIAGDVMGVFVGHDHDNDYLGNYYKICLAFGRYSGGKTVYNNLGKNGCRVIEMQEGERAFSTYIRLLGGEKIYPVDYPADFEKKKEEDKK